MKKFKTKSVKQQIYDPISTKRQIMKNQNLVWKSLRFEKQNKFSTYENIDLHAYSEWSQYNNLVNGNQWQKKKKWGKN